MKNTFLVHLRQKLVKHKLDGFLVINVVNVQYLSGFGGEDTYLLITPKDAWLITDFRYIQQANEETNGFRIIRQKKCLINEVGQLNKRLKIKRLGFESTRLSFALVQELKKAVGKKTRLVPVGRLVESLRVIKTEAELDNIRIAINYARHAFYQLQSFIQPQVIEKEIADQLEYYLRKGGARRSAFDTIVAVDERAALPHARPTEKKVKPQSVILCDWGACYNAYHSDLTRILFMGPPDEKLKDIYQIVLEAQARAIEKIKPGEVIANIDKAARNFIQKQGYGKYFGHGLGHGIGREAHELPGIGSKNKDKLEPGMVFTVEPGIYLPGRGGVRIEDMVLVTQNGCEVLSRDIPKDIKHMILR